MAIAIQCLSKQGIIHRGNVERVSRVPASTLFHYLHRGGHQPGDVGGVTGQDHGVALLGDVAKGFVENGDNALLFWDWRENNRKFRDIALI